MLDYLNRFVEYLKTERQMSVNTVESYTRDIRQYMEYIGNHGLVSFADAGESTVMTYLLMLQNHGKSNATVSRSLSSIRALYQYLLNDGEVRKDPTIKIEAPKSEKKFPSILSLKEIEKLINQPDAGSEAGLRDRAMLELMYATGLRVTELISLDIPDIRIDLGFVRCKGKNGGRIIPVGSMAKEAIQNYLSQVRGTMANEEEQALFVNYQGGRLTRQGFWKIIKRHTKEADIRKEITPHTLRHSFATHMIQNGADIHVLQELMGHSDISSTQMYIQMMDKKFKDEYMRAHPRA